MAHSQENPEHSRPPESATGTEKPKPVHERRRAVIGALIDALPEDDTETDQANVKALASPEGPAKQNDDEQESIPTAAELYALTADSIEPTVAPVAILEEAAEIEVEHPGNNLVNSELKDTYEQPDPHAVINRLISTATSQGSLIAQQRQLLAACLPHLPEHLATEIRACMADSVLGQTDHEEDLIVIEDVAEAP